MLVVATPIGHVGSRVAAGTHGLVPEHPRDVLTTTPTTPTGWAYAHLRPLPAGE